MKELTYRYRLYPTKEQEQKIAQISKTACLLYNRMLKDRTDHYHETGKWKRIDVEAAVKSSRLFVDLDPTVAAWTKKRLEQAYRRFFWIERTQTDRYRTAQGGPSAADTGKKCRDTDLVGYPKFKEQYQFCSWTICGAVVSFTDGRAGIPGVGAVKIVLHRPLPEGAVIKTCTVLKKPSGHYFLLCRLELSDPEPAAQLQGAVGIALAPQNLAVRSDGVPVEFAHQEEALARKIQKAYQTLKRRKPGSARYEKQRRYLAVLIEKRVNQRWDSLHKISREIVEAADAIYVERPEILKRKRKLARTGEIDTVLDEAWWRFSSFLEYKAAGNGKKFWRVARVFPAYRICSACGAFGDDRANEGLFVCPKCGMTMNRAENAAKNYEALGRKYIREWSALNGQV